MEQEGPFVCNNCGHDVEEINPVSGCCWSCFLSIYGTDNHDNIIEIKEDDPVIISDNAQKVCLQCNQQVDFLNDFGLCDFCEATLKAIMEAQN